MRSATLCLTAVVFLAMPALGTPPDHAEWEQTFADEFDGDSVNSDVWASQHSIRGGEKPEGRWPENNVIEDGVLRQITKREDPPREGKEWSTAHIWTKQFMQKYGYFEARMRYGRYLNNAFWLWRPGGNPRPHFEIDINEGHTPRQVAMTFHFYTYEEGQPRGDLWSTSRTWDASVDLDEDFHIYGCEWNEKLIIWYFDGKPVRVLENPNAHAPADIRLSTVIMTHQLAKDGADITGLDGVSMDTDWVRAYRKVKDLREPTLPEAERFELPRIVEQDRQVDLTGERTELMTEDFEGAQAGLLPDGWQVGDREPTVEADTASDGKPLLAEENQALRLGPGDYAFRLFEGPVTGRVEIELDAYNPPGRGEGLLLVTLGDFDQSDAEGVKTSYYTGDIGPYIHWYYRGFLSYYTETDKWTHFARRTRGTWDHFRFVLDVSQGVFDCYAGDSGAEFIGGGVFRHRQKAARGIGLRHRGSKGTVYVDNVTVRRID